MSQYNLKISELYDLLIGGGYKLFIDEASTATGISAAKRWDGEKWVLVYEPSRIMYYNGTAWVNASLR